MTIEEKLKELILTRYRSIREFTQAVDMPYSTVSTILSNGVENANVKTIIKICKALGISADALSEGRIEYVSGITKPRETDLNIDHIVTDLKYKIMTYDNVYLRDRKIDLSDRAIICDHLDIIIEFAARISAKERLHKYAELFTEIHNKNHNKTE